jgi:hypothetical protein
VSWGKHHEAVRAAREYAAEQRGVTRCACGWYFRGRFRDGRAAYLAHRERCGLARAAA